MVRNREKREDLASGVGGVEFVHFVRLSQMARMSWQRVKFLQSYFTLLIMSDTIICARRSVVYRVPTPLHARELNAWYCHGI